MAPEDWEKIETAFQQALELGGTERDAFLAEFEAEDTELGKQLRDLVAADGESDERLSAPIAASVEQLADDSVDPWLGKTIGVWKISRRIAAGGMATVFLADRIDDQFEQQVAIKIMSAQLLSPDAVARFKAERQILADLNHPFIAQLHDGGTTEDGLPYLVMEYVNGLPLDQHCDKRAMSVDARLELFRKICNAVDFAHRNLTVHRDLKPSNILIDTNGEPKLLDFGIAKLLEAKRRDITVAVTQEGTRAMTPEYASPEQVRSEPISVATDVYSLGVLLYRLLTGVSPYGTSVSSSADYERAIVERDPPKPSTVVTENTGDYTGVHHEGLSANQLRNRLSGDLDNIVLKALQKEPERRYLSVAALSEDIRRYVEHRPVEARGADWLYIARKFALRNAKGLTVTALALVAAASMATYYTVRLATERDRAQLEATKATEVTEYLTELFAAADPAVARGETITAAMLLEKGAARINEELEAQPEVRAALLTAMGNSYANMGEFATALTFFRQSRELQDDAAISAKLGQRIGVQLYELGEYDSALEEFSDALQLETAANGNDTVLAGHIMRFIATMHKELGDYEQSEALYKSSIEVLQRHGDSGLVQLAYAKTQYAYLLRTIGDLAGAEPLLLDALAIHQRLFGDTHPSIASTLNNLGNHYRDTGDLEQARNYYSQSIEVKRRLYDKDNVSIARSIANLGVIELDLDNPAESERLSREAMVIFKETLGEDHPHVAFLGENIAEAQLALGKNDEALATFLESARRVEAIFGEDHIEYGTSISNVGGAYLKLGRLNEATVALSIADRIFRDALGDEHPTVAANLVKIGETAVANGDAEYAITIYNEALNIYADRADNASAEQVVMIKERVAELTGVR